MDAESEFATHAWYVTVVASGFLVEMFGERCLDYHEDCEVCKRWKLLDELVASPFATNADCGE